jgi:hypothetical protein
MSDSKQPATMPRLQWAFQCFNISILGWANLWVAHSVGMRLWSSQTTLSQKKIALAGCGLVFLASTLWTMAVDRLLQQESVRSTIEYWFANKRQNLLSWVVERYKFERDLELRDVFRATEITVRGTEKQHNGNEHAVSAGQRSAAQHAFAKICAVTGRKQFSVQRSRVEQIRGIRGSRVTYWSKDLAGADHCDDQPGERDILTMIDTDYYINMLKFLLDHVQPVLLYTVQPEKAATSGHECFRFNSRNELVSVFPGGQSFMHEIWDWGKETVVVSDWWRTVLVQINRRNVAPNRQLVCITPFAYATGPAAWLLATLHGDALERFHPVKNDVTAIMRHTPSGPVYSYAMMDSYVSADLTPLQREAVIASQRAQHVGVHTIRNALKITEHPDPDGAAAVIVQAIAKVPDLRPDASMQVNPLAHVEQYYKVDPNIPVRPRMQQLCNVMVGTTVPARGGGNGEWAAKARVTDIQATTVQTSLKGFALACATEFSELVLGGQNAAPVDPDVVIANQDRPSQRRDNAEAMAELGEGVRKCLRTVIKGEPYPAEESGFKDPRVITPFNAKIKLLWSCYIYAVSQHIKRYDWYGFKPPKLVAQRVAEIIDACGRAGAPVTEGDAHRMDGHVALAARELQLVLLLGFFDPVHHKLIRWLHGLQYTNKAVCEGFKYDTGTSQGSGSADTSVFNTLLSAFMAYLAHRMSGISPAESLEGLGVFAGDDTLNLPINVTNYHRAARLMGQVLKTVERVSVQSPTGHEVGYCSFLGRLFPLTGSNYNIADITRVLVKLPVSANGTYDKDERLVQKINAYLLTDPYTFWVGDIAATARRCLVASGSPHAACATTCDESWWARYAAADQWQCGPPDADEHDWAVHLTFTLAANKVWNLHQLYAHIQGAKSWDEWKQLPFIDYSPRAARVEGVDVLAYAKY